ncbi:hypothetical protein ABZP36_008090 [Zizania latifolia]
MVRKLATLASLFLGGGNDASMSSPCSPPSMSASSSTASSWQWPSCTQARTLSFTWHDARSADNSRHQEVYEYKTIVMNPTYLLDDQSCRSNSSVSAVNMPESLSTAAVGVTDDDEVIIRGLRSSNRLFFEPESTSSIVVKGAGAAAFDGATAMSIDSADPYGDFRQSMEEMVMSHINGATDWGWLEEMLGWYLRANGKKTHGLIVEAFVDLLVALVSPPSPAATATAASACSSSFTPLHAVKIKGEHQFN